MSKTLMACCLRGATSGTPLRVSKNFSARRDPIYTKPTIIKVFGGGGVGDESLLQKGPSPTKAFQFENSVALEGV